MTGPFSTERQARDSVRHIYGEPPGSWSEASHRHLAQVLTAAGVSLGEYDHRIIRWLAGFEPATVAVVAGWIARADRSEV